MLNVLPIITLGLQIIAAIAAVRFLRSNKAPFVTSLCIILILTAITEITGLYLLKLKISSYFLYLTYIFFLFNLISFGFSSIIKLKFKHLLFILPVIFNLSFMFYPLKKSFFTFMVIGSINTSIYSFIYLSELLISDQIINYRKVLPFWVSVGYLVFYLPSIPFFSLIDNMRTRELFFITKILAVLMNVFIIYGLLWSNKTEKYL